MGVIAERLAGVRVHASAPGGGVHGELRGHCDIDIYFSSGWYDTATEHELGRRLEALARLLSAGRERAHREIFTDDPEPESDEDRAFDRERDLLTATGASDDRRITISTRGTRAWRVHIADGALRELDERSFATGLRAAAARLAADQAAQIMRLRGRMYR